MKNVLGKNAGKSFFSMEDIRNIEVMTFHDAQNKLVGIVISSNARQHNKDKALGMINNSQNVVALMLGASNFILAIEDLSTSRGSR